MPSFDRYPFALPAVRHLDVLDFHPQVTFLIGENGSGKSTLLEAIAISLGFNPEGGTKNLHFATRASHSGSLSLGLPAPDGPNTCPPEEGESPAPYSAEPPPSARLPVPCFYPPVADWG